MNLVTFSRELTRALIQALSAHAGRLSEVTKTEEALLAARRSEARQNVRVAALTAARDVVRPSLASSLKADESDEQRAGEHARYESELLECAERFEAWIREADRS